MYSICDWGEVTCPKKTNKQKKKKKQTRLSGDSPERRRILLRFLKELADCTVLAEIQLACTSSL